VWLLLDGPVGLTALARLALVTNGDVDWALEGLARGGDVGRLQDEVGKGVQATKESISRLAQESPDVLLRRLDSTIQNYSHGYAMTWRDIHPRLESCRPELLPLAQELAGVEEIDWWWGPVDRERQMVTEDSTGYKERGVLGLSGWWVAPFGPRILHTTRGPVGRSGSVSSVCLDEAWMPVENPAVARLEATSGRVLEIGSPSDWIAFVASYGLRASGESAREWESMSGARAEWFTPDWRQVGVDYDGVHLTFAGYLSTAYCPLDVGPGLTMLAGWNPDCTAWLRQDSAKTYHDAITRQETTPGPH
jgi:hypothetical protein